MIKMTVPGPFTMAQQCEDHHYRDEEALALDYAAAVNAEIKDLFAAGADVVQLDEPWMQARPEKAKAYGLAALDRALDGVTGTTAVHLCFGYAQMVKSKPSGYSFLPELERSAAQQISIEAAQPKLDLAVLKELPSKTIILGVIDLSDIDGRDAGDSSPSASAARCRTCRAERIVVAPDCGMKYLPRDVAFGKMQAMVEGAAIVRHELTGQRAAIMMRAKPPFRADHVGSLLRSAPLKEARAKREKGEITPTQLKAIEDREIEAIIKKQEAVGLKSITDGEYRRAFWNYDFLGKLDGVEAYLGERKIAFQGPQPKPMMLRVIGKLGTYSAHPMIEHFKFVQAHTKATPKMTIPSPSSLHFRYGRAAVPEAIYPSMDDFYRDLGTTYRKAVRAFADAGCRYLQLDEVNFTYLCDPELRKHVTRRGDDPDATAAHLRAHDQRGDLRHPGRHDDLHASVPRQLPVDLRGLGRLRAGGGDPVQHHQGQRLFHGVRHRARRRLRAAALRAEGQDRGARARHLQERDARKQGRAQAPHRRGGEVREHRPALPLAAMRLRLDRGGQHPRRGASNGRSCG